MEANKQGSGEEDLSMEEILQSIRRIIADDGEEVKPAGAPAAPPAATGSDVLELTDMIEEAPAIAAPAMGDVLGQIDAALNTDAPLAVPTPAPAAPTTPVAAPAAVAGEGLLSSAAESAALASLEKLRSVEPEIPTFTSSPSPRFRSGQTVEDMVEELLRPMMKEWLDANLPGIVERIVDREVKRLTRN